MRLTFLADLRSPLALQWIGDFVRRGDEVQAISSHPVSPEILPGASVSVVPLVFSNVGAGMTQAGRGERRRNSSGRYVRRIVTPARAAAIRSIAGPVAIRFQRSALQALIDHHRPQLIHAMRIPYEGMAAARLTGAPIVVSVWGNDFTLYANRTPLMARATRTTMTHAAALHCDCQRDARLSRQWGFPTQRPVWILPGNGGVVESVFQPGPTTLPQKLGLSDETPIIVDPRGIREYVRTDVLFASLAHVLKRVPDVHVVCPGMAGSPIAESLVKENRLDHRVHLLPPVGRDEMGDIFRAARASVSLSTHDGTPNTLLEAMACGALPVVGDVESVREWVTHDHNGLVVRPDDQDGVAAALVRALTDDNLVDCARLVNAEIVHERASFSAGMQRAREYYQRLIEVADRAATPAD